MKPHWYFILIEECVLCGRTHKTRERRYGVKPKTGTRQVIETACQSHFL